MDLTDVYGAWMSYAIHARIAERASDKDTWDCRRAFALVRNQMQDRNRQAKHQDKLNHQLVHRQIHTT